MRFSVAGGQERSLLGGVAVTPVIVAISFKIEVIINRYANGETDCVCTAYTKNCPPYTVEINLILYTFKCEPMQDRPDI
jgi:hypothetical protein